MEDIQRMNAIAEGDQNAFRDLYAQFSDRVYNTAISYLQKREDAEEVTQTVFTQIFRKANTYKGDSALATWIYRITVNTSLNYIKKKKRFSFLSLQDVGREREDFVHPGFLLENQEKGKLLFRCLDELPTKQKTAFILGFIEGLPRQEIADIMGQSLKATESLLQRAKGNLRKKLEKFYPERRKPKK